MMPILNVTRLSSISHYISPTAPSTARLMSTYSIAQHCGVMTKKHVRAQTIDLCFRKAWPSTTATFTTPRCELKRTDKREKEIAIRGNLTRTKTDLTCDLAAGGSIVEWLGVAA